MGRIFCGLLAQTPAAHSHTGLNPPAGLLSGPKFAGPHAGDWQRGRDTLVLRRRATLAARHREGRWWLSSTMARKWHWTQLASSPRMG
jgi:hypothetical protein